MKHDALQVQHRLLSGGIGIVGDAFVWACIRLKGRIGFWKTWRRIDQTSEWI